MLRPKGPACIPGGESRGLKGRWHLYGARLSRLIDANKQGGGQCQPQPLADDAPAVWATAASGNVMGAEGCARERLYVLTGVENATDSRRDGCKVLGVVYMSSRGGKVGVGN